MLTRRAALFLAALPALPAAPAGKTLVIIILGPPTSGKTTQAEKIKKQYGLPIISPQTMIKMSHDRKSEFTKKVKGKLASDEILNDEGMNGLLQQSLNRMDVTGGFILDGYPVTKGQADYLGETLKQFGLSDPLVVSLEIPEATLRARAEKSGRADDKPAIFERRYANYQEESAAILSYYPKVRVAHIDAAKAPEEVFTQIRSAIDSGR
jgi:adenylate kinase